MGRLYNRQYAKQRGREKRLEAEMNAFTEGVSMPALPPLFSHDATLQSYFNTAWQRVSQCEINMHVGKARTPQASGLIENIKEFRECHFPS